MMSGMPCRCATLASAATSATSVDGFATDPAKIARVSGPISDSTKARSLMSSTKSVSMPNSGNRLSIASTEALYRFRAVMMRPPPSAAHSNAAETAVMPEAKATAERPPSNAAMRRSSTSSVGLAIREYEKPSAAPAESASPCAADCMSKAAEGRSEAPRRCRWYSPRNHSRREWPAWRNGSW